MSNARFAIPSQIDSDDEDSSKNNASRKIQPGQIFASSKNNKAKEPASTIGSGPSGKGTSNKSAPVIAPAAIVSSEAASATDSAESAKSATASTDAAKSATASTDAATVKPKSMSSSASTSARPGASGAKNAIIVNSKQRGNPILKHVTSVAYEYGDIVPDYQVGATSCVLYLSLRYHNLNPEYIQKRLDDVKNMYELRVLLVQVDIKDPHHSLKELALLCILANFTLIVAWTPEEAGRYLETYKIYENKPPDAIMSRPEGDFQGRVADALTTVKGVNKTDATTLLTTFDSFASIVRADEEKLLLCPGMGPLKAKRLHQLFDAPFSNWK